MDFILVVDDDAGYLRVVSMALSLGGFRVSTATNGREALAALRGRRPAAVLLDLNMPVMDGPAFARALRQQPDPPPIVVVSGAPNAAQQAREIGAAAWVTKPVDPFALVTVIARACEARAAPARV